MIKTIKSLILAAIFMVSAGAMAKFEKEDFYNKQYCAEMGGTFGQYHKNTGATRAFVDCETNDTVWEGEWSHKSYEAVGQSLWYASITGKKPGLLFYIKKDNQDKYIKRAILTMESLGIEYEIRVIDLRRNK